MQFLERLESNDSDERWLVQYAKEAPHVVWFLDDDRDRLDEISRATPVGRIHPRVAAIRRVTSHGRRLAIECEDDRGPLLVSAARVVEHPEARERWVIAQIVAICEGLAALRKRDETFVHRQLEPERMYIDIAGRARLRAPIPSVLSGKRPARMGAGTVRGTPGYMAPEQARGGVPSAATDVFALAANLYEALSGARPFARESMMDELMAILNDEPPPITTHAPGLADVLRRAFLKDQHARIQDPGTFAGELRRCVPDAADYDEVVSDRIVEWRTVAANEPARRPMFGARCRMKWEELDDRSPGVRHCSSCQQDVVRVHSIAAVLPLFGTQCISYTGGD
jgi:serine/threonine protein kinase